MYIADADPPITALNSLMALVPWLILFVILWVTIFIALKRRTRQQAERRVMQERIASLEQQVADLPSRKQTPPPGR